MSLLEAFVLGVVQGLTEFLPISSSAHLVLVPELLGWAQPTLPYLVLLHSATLVALVAYFWRDLLFTAAGVLKPGPQRRFGFLLVLGTAPAAVIGAVFEEQFESSFGKPFQVAIQLVVSGILLVGAELLAKRRKAVEAPAQSGGVADVPPGTETQALAEQLSPAGAVLVGFAQALSIVPGISRSGSTIAGGLLVGLNRAQAARFSFLLAVPILLGTSIFEVPQLQGSGIGVAPLIIGFLASLVSGYLAIAGMIAYLQRRGLYPFVAYCVVVGILAAMALAGR